MTTLSNRLTDLAERVKEATAASALAGRTSIEKAIEAGRFLIDAKAAVRHGDWLPFLQRAGIVERTARNFMTLAASGLNPAPVADLGGIKAALAFLSKWRLPTFDEALMITSAERQGEFDAGAEWTPGAVGYVWESEKHRGHYHIAAMDDGDNLSLTKSPMWPKIHIEDGEPVATIIHWLSTNFNLPMGDWHIEFAPRHVPEIVLPDRVLREAVQEFAERNAA